MRLAVRGDAGVKRSYHVWMKYLRSILWLGCMGVLLTGGGVTLAQDADPDTLFLTWFDDPTTSIVAQWLEAGEPLPLAEGATDDKPGFDVPKVEDVTVDGKTDDWADKGFEIMFLAGVDGEVFGPADLSATAKLGWDERGLLVLIEVRDDVADESDDPESLWAADAVEVFISTGVGSDQRYQVLVSPGADDKRDGPRQWFYDYRRERASGDLEAESACAVVEGGYVVEMMLPWSNLGIGPEALADGGEAAFQFYVDDRDGGEETKGIWWHRDRDAHEQPESMYRLWLTDRAGAASVARAEVQRDGGEAELIVWADEGLAGQTVTVKSGDLTLGEIELVLADGRALAVTGLSDPPAGTRWGTISGYVGGERVACARPMKWMTVTRPEDELVALGSFFKMEDNSPRPVGPTAKTTILPFGDYSGLFLHRAVFNGLQPDGEYVLRFGGEDGTAYRFRTAPATLDEPLVFAEGGDVGVWERVAPLHQIAAAWGPRFGLIGGDCAYANGRTPQRWVEFLRLWREHMVDPDGRLIPMLCAIGNHEVDGSWGQPRERSPYFLALFDGLYPEHSYAAIDFGDYLSLVLLDSGHLSAHDGEQAGWLDKTLAERVDRPHLFTAYHVPAYPSHRDFEGKYSELARRYWVPLFDRYGVDVSFEHHDHTYKRTHRLTGGERDPGGVLYLGDGAWGMEPRTVATPEERPYLQKSISSRNVIRVTLDGDGRQFLAVDDEGRVIDRYPETD